MARQTPVPDRLKPSRAEGGRMAVDDIELIAGGLPPVQLQIAEPELIRPLHGRQAGIAQAW